MNHPDGTTTIAFGIPKFPARFAPLVTAFLLSVLMTCIVSFISTLKGVGLSPQFVSQWMTAWGLSWVVAFPVLLLVLPVVRRATAALVRAG
ncbi:DUF2798 domain-containing protein [Caldimonas thermodepolymerans]|jgi:Protein of unknown function (DUF2798).|uniref:DUF2798 domain-containing protein n=1 Tax=Caldimonas thermodepolymerans TaxID=215580 RepID=A0A2S5T0T8_9BURK|nr:DUF2798 domain-containing protein [Caldimonas thermodepolymerans]PPE68645.1 DUF2798 domain-containing protein [Caldimonas thermodepolymerans]QPC30824.1 DUF2798 domain-containing protein [Caldimonas thermodepolymerans]RDH94958.1 uncharacterized protein DUF2798 [Caldimonas thermodepolymerans]TCP08921.1 uncharacterized protein DUF2798 [Caldimonas thermodepolymerans]UZG43563.1 DUF2798 domain-containing protein [Caldimonas thermodepolymerans]